ncbi:MAG: HPP family protein [Gemmatimonadales bacterium]
MPARHQPQGKPVSDRPLTVADAMTSKVVTIAADSPISEAVSRLADSHITALAVVNSHQKLVGVVSVQDILSAEAEAGDEQAREVLLRDTLIQDIMTAPALTVGPDLPLREAALEMEYADIHRLFVEVNGQLAGVVSLSDINRMFARQG